MKRVKSACIQQTLMFIQKPELGFGKEQALKANRAELDHYKATLERAGTKYQITDVTEQDDGSVIVRVRKQYNSNTDVSEYFN